MSACLFLIFNRPDTTQRVFDAIRAQRPQRLYVAADGPRDRPGEAILCADARRIATAIDWPCEVKTLFRDRNLGCQKAVSSAIDWFFENEDEGIILEDDCLPSADFFRFCAEMLERCRDDERVMAICGTSYCDEGAADASRYSFSYYADMWGWATWRRAWRFCDHTWSRWPAFSARGGLSAIGEGAPWRARYWSRIFGLAAAGAIDTWDYAWLFSIIERGGLACYPHRNLVSNLGFRPDATHTIDTVEPRSALAGRPFGQLNFPLVHDREPRRMADFERRMDAVRLWPTALDALLVPRPGSVSSAQRGSALERLGGAARQVVDSRRWPLVMMDGLKWRMLPRSAWGTKGFEFWTYLSALLTRSGCRRLLELGSGRSTLALAEYAHARGATFVSIETSRQWWAKAGLEMAWLGLSGNPVRHVGWNGERTWYDLVQFTAAIGDEPFDFALIDGPSDLAGNSQGIRDDAAGLVAITQAVRGADLLVIDDVHRRHIFDSVARMLGDTETMDIWYLDYDVGNPFPNTLAICARLASPAHAAVEPLADLFGLMLTSDFDASQCVAD